MLRWALCWGTYARWVGCASSGLGIVTNHTVCLPEFVSKPAGLIAKTSVHDPEFARYG